MQLSGPHKALSKAHKRKAMEDGEMPYEKDEKDPTRLQQPKRALTEDEADANDVKARKTARKDDTKSEASGSTRRSSPPPRSLRVKLTGAGNCTRQMQIAWLESWVLAAYPRGRYICARTACAMRSLATRHYHAENFAAAGQA
eukprot:6191694-Pleurochrysis_carterae.AAC.3